MDEDQHRRYIKNDEGNKYDDLFMDFSGKYIFIRYNPDKFIDKYGKSKNPMFNIKMEVLEKIIHKYTNKINNYKNKDLVKIHHIFYNEEVWEDFIIIFYYIISEICPCSVWLVSRRILNLIGFKRGLGWNQDGQWFNLKGNLGWFQVGSWLISRWLGTKVVGQKMARPSGLVLIIFGRVPIVV